MYRSQNFGNKIINGRAIRQNLNMLKKIKYETPYLGTFEDIAG